MNAAPLSSPRLQAFLRVLSDGHWRSTREIIRESGLCAINSCAAECRAGGLNIQCRRDGSAWLYKWVREPAQMELAA